MRRTPVRHPSRQAFSLIEVVFALGLCAFALVGLLGALGTGLQFGKESEGQIQASDLASLLVSTRMGTTTNDIANFAIPVAAMKNLYGSVGGPSYIGFDGKLATESAAAYQVTCMAGTNYVTGSGICQIYLMLTWPPQAPPTSAATERYELLTYVPTR